VDVNCLKNLKKAPQNCGAFFVHIATDKNLSKIAE
jgi:hypothetical protein